MRVFAATVLCALAFGATPALGQDITGTWDVAVTTPQGDMPSVLTLKKDGEKFVGTIASQMGEIPVEAAVKDKAVSIYFTLNMNGTNVDVVFNGTIDGESMKGMADVSGMGQMEWRATRQAATAPGAPPKTPAPAAQGGTDVTGTWNLDVKTDAGSGTPTLILKQDGEKLTGEYQSSQFGTAQIVGTLKGSSITFSFDISAQGNALHVVYTGTVEKDTMKGSVDFGGMGSGSFTGKKR